MKWGSGEKKRLLNCQPSLIRLANCKLRPLDYPRGPDIFAVWKHLHTPNEYLTYSIFVRIRLNLRIPPILRMDASSYIERFNSRISMRTA